MKKRERKERKMTCHTNTSSSNKCRKDKMIACVSGLADLIFFFVLDSDDDDLQLGLDTLACIPFILYCKLVYSVTLHDNKHIIYIEYCMRNKCMGSNLCRSVSWSSIKGNFSTKG